MIKKLLAWASVLIWMGVIFNFSAQNAKQSSTLSRGITEIVYKSINSLPGMQLEINVFHSLLRQTAHFLIFFILALLLITAFRVEGLNVNHASLFTIIIAVIYAFLDEYHQSFVPGRAAELKDVFIDSLGIITGVGLYRAILFLISI